MPATHDAAQLNAAERNIHGRFTAVELFEGRRPPPRPSRSPSWASPPPARLMHRFAEGDGLWQMAQDAEFVPLEIIFGDLRALYSAIN